MKVIFKLHNFAVDVLDISSLKRWELNVFTVLQFCLINMCLFLNFIYLFIYFLLFNYYV